MLNLTLSHLFMLIKLLSISMILLISACSSGNKQISSPVTVAEPPPTAPAVIIPARATNEAQVKDIVIHLMESFPLRVNVVVRGSLPDSCTTLDQFTQELRGNTFVIKILTAPLAGRACAQVTQPFDQVIPLAVEDLKAGVYTVEVNGVSENFEFSLDNMTHHNP